MVPPTDVKRLRVAGSRTSSSAPASQTGGASGSYGSSNASRKPCHELGMNLPRKRRSCVCPSVDTTATADPDEMRLTMSRRTPLRLATSSPGVFTLM